MPPVKKGDKKVIYDHTEILAKKISCMKCHGKMVVGDGAVPRNRCSNCHAELHKIEKYSDTELMHKNHITDHKIECNQCHTDVQHKSVARTESVRPDCNSCHTNTHNAQLQMFIGKGGKRVKYHPSLMFSAGLNCQACHVYHEMSRGFEIDNDTLTANEKSCEPCHGKGYSKLLGIWKKQTDTKIRQIEKILKISEREVKKIKDPAKKNEADKLYSDAIYNFELVKFGKSIHNISFANILLKKSYQLAKESLIARPGVSLPPFNTKHSMIPGECSNCHKKILVKTVDIFGLKFVHKRHLSHEEISCQKCHSNISKHGQLVVKKSDCMNCHHDKKMEEKCSVCHTQQADIYAGKFSGKDMNTPNIMKDDVSCSGCHYDDDSKIIRPKKSVCSNCHDKDYEEMFEEWIADSEKVLKSLERKAASSNKAVRERAKKILIILRKDGSKGIHNPELYQKLEEGI